MFAVPGILLLVALLYLRPQELIPALRELPLLPVFLGLAIFGFAVDLKLRKSRLMLTPQLGWVALFFGFCPGVGLSISIPIIVYVVIGHGVQTFRALEAVTGTLLAAVLVRCLCESDPALQDPNELALTLFIALPFAFAFFKRKRSATRLLLALVATVLVGYRSAKLLEPHSGFGVGAGQRVLAELGFPGLVLFSVVLYVSVKIPVRAIKCLRALGPEADVARAWAVGLLASLGGLVVGSLFVPVFYDPVLWIYVGLSGAFFCAMKRHDPEYAVRFGWRDCSLVIAIDALLIGIGFVSTLP